MQAELDLLSIGIKGAFRDMSYSLKPFTRGVLQGITYGSITGVRGYSGGYVEFMDFRTSGLFLVMRQDDLRYIACPDSCC